MMERLVGCGAVPDGRGWKRLAWLKRQSKGKHLNTLQTGPYATLLPEETRHVLEAFLRPAHPSQPTPSPADRPQPNAATSREGNAGRRALCRTVSGHEKNQKLRSRPKSPPRPHSPPPHGFPSPPAHCQRPGTGSHRWSQTLRPRTGEG